MLHHMAFYMFIYQKTYSAIERLVSGALLYILINVVNMAESLILCDFVFNILLFRFETNDCLNKLDQKTQELNLLDIIR